MEIQFTLKAQIVVIFVALSSVSELVHGSLRFVRCGNSVVVQRTSRDGVPPRYGCCDKSIVYDRTKAICCGVGGGGRRGGGGGRRGGEGGGGGGQTLIGLNDTLNRGCCGGQTVYNKTSQICCQDRFLHEADSRTSCCGRIAYDTRKYYCDNEKLTGYDVDTCVRGRTVIVHLFDWKWTDIADECERLLGPSGFCGVQVSPPNEHLVISNPSRPWYERYQPISYRLISRSGNEDEFRDMVRRCNAVDVRIYVDVVINHMCGNDVGTGNGSGGSFFDSRNKLFPAVPFGPDDFNCCQCHRCGTQSCDIDDFGNANQVRNCRLLGLLDLDLGKDYVRQKVTDFLNNLTDHGVAGFRIDAAKHMWPADLDNIYSRLNNLATLHGFPAGTRPFIFMEVIDQGGEPIQSTEYLHLGRVTEFKFSRDIGRVFRRHFHLSSFGSFPHGWGYVPAQNALVFVDNHDNQRGHGGGGSTILTFHDPRPYTLATVFTLAHPYGFARVMSSHRWDGGSSTNDWIGPPHEADWSVKNVELDENGTCLGDWVCEHRWNPIRNMVRFRNVAQFHPLENWWDNGRHQVAFSRGDRAFVVINNEASQSIDSQLQTGLREGTYCDVISGNLVGNECTGKSVTVEADGRARILLSHAEEIPAVAIHVESRLARTGEVEEGVVGSPAVPHPDHDHPTEEVMTGFRRTAILVRFSSQLGQHVFLRGGISHNRSCSGDANRSRCAISIRHRDLGQGDHYNAYNAWKVNDRTLDWQGAETNQGQFDGHPAQGSPTVWTTNKRDNAQAFKNVNRFGDHYWMLDVDMDCDSTESGWFEVKTFVVGHSSSGGWESDISQDLECIGRRGGSKPYATKNHLARCGYINAFRFSESGCTVDDL